MEFTEADHKTVARIQEIHGGTLQEARSIYRKRVLRLANPDIANRAEIILENYLRLSGNESTAVEHAIAGQKKLNRNEKRLVNKGMKKVEVREKQRKRQRFTGENKQKCKRCHHLFGRHHIKRGQEYDVVKCEVCECEYRKPGKQAKAA